MSTAQQVGTGIAEEQRKQIAQGLSRLLADSYTLFLKTHNFHWNVNGPMFIGLHDQFEKQYRELFEAIDEVAERIRALGYAAPGSYKQYAELANVKEETRVPEWKDMVRQLAADQETLVHTARDVLTTAEEAGDQVTVDIATRRMLTHEKTAWMLRSILESG